MNDTKKRFFLSQNDTETEPISTQHGKERNSQVILSDEELNELYPLDDILVNVCSKLKENAQSIKNQISSILGMNIPIPINTNQNISYSNEIPFTLIQQSSQKTTSSNNSSYQTSPIRTQKPISSSETTESEYIKKISQNTVNQSQNELISQEHENSMKQENISENHSLNSTNESSTQLSQQNLSQKYLSSTTDSTSIQEDQIIEEFQKQQEDVIKNDQLEEPQLDHDENDNEPKNSNKSIQKSQQKTIQSPIKTTNEFIPPSKFKEDKTGPAPFRYPLGRYAQRNMYTDMAPIGFSQFTPPSEK